MATLERFHSPGYQAEKDFGNDLDGLDQFNEQWNNNLNRWTNQSIVGNPWSNQYDDNRYYYVNPLTTSLNPGNPVPITWNPFPNRLFNFFQDPQAPANEQLSTDQIFALADAGAITINGVTTPIGNLQVPQQLCPNNNWQGTLIGYTPTGSRGWLDEYCEWSIRYDPDGQLRSVMFTCENPAYWFTLWRVNPDLVVKLYQQIINPAVQREDLYLLDSNGKPVFDPLTNDYAYDPTNKWNRDTTQLADRGGAMHLTSGPNTLSAEIYLAAAATIARTCGNTDPQTLICCSQYGRPRRNSDPHIGQLANQVAVNGQTAITLTDPVGLYIQSPNTKLWAVKNQPDYPVANLWQVTRGEVNRVSPGNGNDSILHAIFTVPEGMQASDILITDSQTGKQEPLQWAGQIARSFMIALRASTAPLPTSGSNPVPQHPQPCVVVMDSTYPNLQPWPVQFLPNDLYQANSPIDLSPSVPQGSSTLMALVVQGGLENASIEFSPPDGIEPVVIEQYINDNSGSPGQTSGGSTQVYLFTLKIDANAPLGDRNLRVVNLDKEAPIGGVPWIPGLLNIVANT